MDPVYPGYLNYANDSTAEIYLYPNLVQLNVFPGLLDESHVERIIGRMIQITSGKKYLVLVLPSAQTRISFFALRMLASEAAMSYSKATAYVVASTHQQLMGETFLRLYRPGWPVRIFNAQANALRWLEMSFD